MDKSKFICIMECARDDAIDKCYHTKQIRHEEDEYEFIIEMVDTDKLNDKDESCYQFDITLYNDSANHIKFSFLESVNNVYEKPIDVHLTLKTSMSPYKLTRSILLFFEKYIMINDDNVLNVYNTSFQQICKIITHRSIKAIKVTNKFIILDCSIEYNNRHIEYYYELYNFCFQRVDSIKKEIRFITNPINSEQFMICVNDDFISKTNGSYVLYETKEEVECSICLEPIEEIRALVPCGHTNLCVNCYKQKNIKQCPLCRGNVLMQIKVFK